MNKVGRPPAVKEQLEQLKTATRTAKLVQQELRSIAQVVVGFKIGKQVLLDSYPELMKRAVELATDAEKPDRQLLLGLLTLAPKLVGEGDDSEDTGITRLLKSVKRGDVRDINVSQTNIYGKEERDTIVVESSSEERTD